jgi:hypothetical protein
LIGLEIPLGREAIGIGLTVQMQDAGLVELDSHRRRQAVEPEVVATGGIGAVRGIRQLGDVGCLRGVGPARVVFGTARGE